MLQLLPNASPVSYLACGCVLPALLQSDQRSFATLEDDESDDEPAAPPPPRPSAAATARGGAAGRGAGGRGGRGAGKEASNREHEFREKRLADEAEVSGGITTWPPLSICVG